MSVGIATIINELLDSIEEGSLSSLSTLSLISSHSYNPLTLSASDY